MKASDKFSQLPAYLAQLRTCHPDIHIQLETVTVTSDDTQVKFQRVFICPAASESRVSFQHMRKFMAVDGIFLKAKLSLILLLAVGIDANGKNLILAWSVLESENKASWTWYLMNLKETIPESIGITLISDRDKGLEAAESTVYGDTIQRLICCYHLKGIYSSYYYIR